MFKRGGDPLLVRFVDMVDIDTSDTQGLSSSMTISGDGFHVAAAVRLSVVLRWEVDEGPVVIRDEDFHVGGPCTPNSIPNGESRRPGSSSMVPNVGPSVFGRELGACGDMPADTLCDLEAGKMPHFFLELGACDTPKSSLFSGETRSCRFWFDRVGRAA